MSFFFFSQFWNSIKLLSKWHAIIYKLTEEKLWFWQLFYFDSYGLWDATMLPRSMASFLRLIVSMSTGQLRGIVLFWCLSALCCPVSSALMVPLNWQSAYKSASSEDCDRHNWSTKCEKKQETYFCAPCSCWYRWIL